MGNHLREVGGMLGDAFNGRKASEAVRTAAAGAASGGKRSESDRSGNRRKHFCELPRPHGHLKRRPQHLRQASVGVGNGFWGLASVV